MTKKRLLNKVLTEVFKLWDDYDWSGSENDDGELQKGTPNFGEAILNIKKIFNDNHKNK